MPDLAVKASLGCGNPTALAELRAGETVLDLGSGGGIDVLLSARRVGPTGRAYGLDMTDEMLALAEENKRKSGLENVEFLKGEIEHIPLPDNSVDVIISNCVINLSGDKDRVIKEAFRVLKPGGRFAVSDVVVRGQVPPEIRRNMELWVGCVAGALGDYEYVAKLAKAGFDGIDIETTRVYSIEDARPFSPVKGSTWTRSPGRSRARSSAASSGPRSRPPRRAAARAAAADAASPTSSLLAVESTRTIEGNARAARRSRSLGPERDHRIDPRRAPRREPRRALGDEQQKD